MVREFCERRRTKYLWQSYINTHNKKRLQGAFCYLLSIVAFSSQPAMIRVGLSQSRFSVIVKVFSYMETLSKLFGSEAKVKILRLFIFNPEHIFDTSQISQRVKEPRPKVRREISLLEKVGLVKRRGLGTRKKKSYGFAVNPSFNYFSQLQNFLITTEPLNPKELIKRISRLGSIKLIIAAGVFIQEPESRIDLLIVGDNVSPKRLDNMMKKIESEVGKELKYAFFSTEDFKYRLNMYDKLVRDVLDYPHKVILNKLSFI